MAKTKEFFKKKVVLKNPKVILSRIPGEQLRSLLQGCEVKGSVEGDSGDTMEVATPQENILEDKIRVLEEELCRKNQLIESLQEQIRKLQVDKDNPEMITSDDSFQLSFDADLNISVDKLLTCKAIAKRRAEEIGVENQIDISKACSSSEEAVSHEVAKDSNVSLADQDLKEEQEKAPTPKSASRTHRRTYRKNKVSASSMRT